MLRKKVKKFKTSSLQDNLMIIWYMLLILQNLNKNMLMIF